MDDEELVAIIQTLINDSNATDDTVTVYLNLARQKMLKWLYPFETEAQDLPEIYQYDLCELASRMYLRRGAEGEASHSENSVSRSYDSVDDKDILMRLTPFAKVVK